VGYAPVTAETLNLLPSLELIVASSAGVDHIDIQECRRRGIIMTNASTAFAEDAADYAVALLIDVWRRISAADRFLHAGLWPVKGDYPLASKVLSFLFLYLVCFNSFF
jgi:hydroxypyruvate reductase 2